MAPLINYAVTFFITAMLGIQATIWYDFFFKTPHPGPREIITANHLSQITTLLLFLPGLYLIGTNIDTLSWFTLLYFVAGLLEAAGARYAFKAAALRKREVIEEEKEIQERIRRLEIIRRRRQLLTRG